MLIYKDYVSGDELCGDSYPMKEVDDLVYEFDGKNIVVDNEIDDSLIGGNPSAEEGGDGTESGSEKKINVVHSHSLVSTNFSKGDYQKYLKGYLKKITERLATENPARLDVFKNKMMTYMKEVILPNFKDYDFYLGESMNPDGMVVLMNYRDDGLTPYFILFKDGLIEEKC